MYLISAQKKRGDLNVSVLSTLILFYQPLHNNVFTFQYQESNLNYTELTEE